MQTRYATGAHLIARYDSRTVAELASDTGTPSNSPSGNSNVLSALDDASGLVLSAATARGAYSAEQLDQLAADSDPMLIRLTCVLAIGMLFSRRMQGIPDGVRAEVDAANDVLAQLRNGSRLLNVPETRSAALPSGYRPTQQQLEVIAPVTLSPLHPSVWRGPRSL